VDLVGSSSNATSKWAAKLGLHLQSSTLKDNESGEPRHVQQRKRLNVRYATLPLASPPSDRRIHTH
jgi:hypothetical protein